ncbi:hypothetical protein BRC89_02450 [Halobacteriales archaeon QS_4_70_19]|nr:MAG: hypothetical protein BRC89_02450 [Halobacteriales archaeon QS_4_70_19]
MTDQARSRTTDSNVDQVAGVRSVLVLAPEMMDPVKRVCDQLLDPDSSEGTGVIKISYHFSPVETADRWLADNPDSETPLYCLSITDSTFSENAHTYPEHVSFATARADDLTGIGMKINQIVQEMNVHTSDIRVCLDSLDNMLMYVDRQTVYRFIRTISNFLSANEARIHFHINPSRNDEIVDTLRSALNAVVEVGETGVVDIKTR